MVCPYDITRHTDGALTLWCIAGLLARQAEGVAGGLGGDNDSQRERVPRAPGRTGMLPLMAGTHDPGE